MGFISSEQSQAYIHICIHAALNSFCWLGETAQQPAAQSKYTYLCSMTIEPVHEELKRRKNLSPTKLTSLAIKKQFKEIHD